ncbi:ATP-grasp domain-containing protein [Yoonia sp.]|nr:ATP-grasp domain-containing protein [Yoonia sp.]MDC1399290.1 ATP-grasp domain-containing protein [Yoonia sp.]
MAHTGTQKRKTPRKSAVAKAALRKSAAGGNVAQSHKSASKADLAEALANRPKVDFLDPFMRHAGMQAKGIGLCAFLVTLAAFQRGLKVTFHYERASFDPRFAKAKMQGHRGELFSISNGTRTHVFSRTLGDLTDPAANAIAEDKHLTKAALKRAGVRTPEGIVVDKAQTALIEKFLAQNLDKRFVVKPHDGSMGRDVHANLLSSQVLDAVKTIDDGRIVLEEHIEGVEHRAFVVGNRFVSSFIKMPANVVGDGTRTIRQLIQSKNADRLNNPRLASNLIKEMDPVSEHLAKSGRSLETVPTSGERVILLATSSVSRGGDPLDSKDSDIGDLSTVTVAGCEAIGLCVSGLDVILRTHNGQTEAYIIELNQRPHIGAQSFPMEGPGQGNAVAEAIMDYYFPETIHDRTRANIAYDFAPIRAALDSAQISDLSLPVIGPDWKVLRFTETGIAAKAMAQLIETAARTAGVFTMSAPHDKGGVALCLAYAPANFRNMLSVIPAQFRRRLEQLDAEVKG